MIKEFESFSAKDTFEFARELAKNANKSDIFCLDGDLGVGKTVFTQGFAKGIGIEGIVNSPTFTIMQIYEDGRMPLYHFDLYRLSDIAELDDIGYEEFFFGEGVSLVEWGSLFREIFPKDTIFVTIEKDLNRGLDYRKIICQSKD